MGFLDASDLIVLLPSIVGMVTIIVLLLELKQRNREFVENNKPLIYIGDKDFDIKFNKKGKIFSYSWNHNKDVNEGYFFKVSNIGNKPAINLEYHWDWETNCLEYLKILKSLDLKNEYKIDWMKTGKFKLLSIGDSNEEITDFYTVDKKVPIRFAPFITPLNNSEIYLDEGIILPKVIFLKAQEEVESITQEDLKLPKLKLHVYYNDTLQNKYVDLFEIHPNKEFYPLDIDRTNNRQFHINGTFKVVKVSTTKIKK